MANTSPARSSSPAAPTLSSPQATAADSETAPLLSQDPAPAEADASNADPEANAPPNTTGPQPTKKHVLILTWLSLALSICSLTFIIAAYALIGAVPFYVNYYWQIEQSVGIVVPITTLAALLSLANLIRLRMGKVFLPLAINIILDIIILVYNIPASINALNFTFSSTSVSCSYEDPEGACDQRAHQLQILMAFAMVMALGVGIVHLVLFIFRCIEAYRTRFWRPESRPAAWRFPTGTFTVEFTVKVLRQEREGQIRI